MVERAGVVVAEIAQRVGNAVGTLGNHPYRVVDRLALTQCRENREGGSEHRRVVLLKDGLPCDFKNFSRVSRSRDLVEPDNSLHLRFIPQTTLQEARVAEHQCRNCTNSLCAAVILRDQIKSLRQWTLHLLVLKHGACATNGIGDFIGNKLARFAEPRGSRDVRVNALLGFLQIEFSLNLLALGLAYPSAARFSRCLRRSLFVHLDEVGGRFSKATVMGL